MKASKYAANAPLCIQLRVPHCMIEGKCLASGLVRFADSSQRVNLLLDRSTALSRTVEVTASSLQAEIFCVQRDLLF